MDAQLIESTQAWGGGERRERGEEKEGGKGEEEESQRVLFNGVTDWNVLGNSVTLACLWIFSLFISLSH